MSNKEEALLILQEECAEVIHIANKALRFGLLDIHPETGVVNSEALAEEIGHVLAMVDVAVKLRLVDAFYIELGRGHKAKKLKQWSSL